MKQDRDLEVDNKKKKKISEQLDFYIVSDTNQKAQVSNSDQDTQLSSVSL